MSDLLAGYATGRAWDELFAAPSVPRAPYQDVHASIARLSAGDLAARADRIGRILRDLGLTFDFAGEERPFPLDLVPRIIAADEWAPVERGVAQRVRALEAFLADVYGPQEVLRDGVVPRRVVVSSAHFHRQAAGLTPPNGVRVHVSGIDLVRDEQGRFRVLEDNVRVPSGVSYVIENRRTLARVLPELFSTYTVRRVSDYPARLLAALRAAAPPAAQDPTVVLLTPGVYNAAYAEHAHLARQMGVELVEGRDLVCRDNRVYMRTTLGQRRVHVIYRRVDDEWLDPVHFRADSAVGCPGLMNAARGGNVTLANAVGNGVADDKLLYTYVPDLVRYYLREEPVLDNVDTWRLEDPDALVHVLDHMDEMVLKPVDGSGGKGIVIGPLASAAQLTRLRSTVRGAPRDWIAQRPVWLSTVPTFIGERLVPRHVDLRPFAVNDGTDVWVLPGGLTRVALPEGGLIVNSSQGGGSKDTWVLSPARRTARPTATGGGRRPLAAVSPPEAGPGAGAAEQQQQQQQQQGRSAPVGDPSC